MSKIAVTGAAGSVGKELISLLSVDPDVGSIIALDRKPVLGNGPKIRAVRVDLLAGKLADSFDGCDSIVHLAEQYQHRAGSRASLAALDRVLEAARDVGCRHVVILSSALVYGAHEDNPVPMTEDQPRRPVPDVPYAVLKTALEERAERWLLEDSENSIAVLRPTATLSERGVSWIAGELSKATAIRSGKVDPPVQFLHHDDLAAAVALVASKQLSGTFNVAPDGWMSSSVFQDLCGQTQLGIGDSLALKYREGLGLIGIKGTSGLRTYATYPWVVANDRLRTLGWQPTFSSEEAYVAGTPAPVWDTVPAGRRQEVAMAAATVSLLALVVLAWRLLVRALR